MDLSKLNWHEMNYFDTIPDKVIFWIRDNQSLTQKLRNKYKDFRVEVHKHEESEIYIHEANKFSEEKEFIVREVSLYGDNQPVVFARSVIPKNTKLSSIANIGNKPLGEVLYNDPNISREQIEVTLHKNLWGRRSVFIINESQILVSEFFLEKLYA